MKKVGILTMHRVLNNGSALQAYATQEFCRRLGYDAELIDYVYPNEYHRKQRMSLKFVLLKFVRFFLHFIQGFPLQKTQRLFATFYERWFVLSEKKYESRQDLQQEKWSYDVFMVGSDQVWNPRHIVSDNSFFFDFLSLNLKCVSFSSSLAQKGLTEEQSKLFKEQLQKFSAISVREKNGQILLSQLLSRKIECHIDPTLLLTKSDYLPIAKQSVLKIEEPYILVYILKYAYHPYPYVNRVIEEAHRKTGLKVVCLDFSSRERLRVKNVKYLRSVAGPSEFLYLFLNASLVITTSFHGTAFSLNFGTPFYSIVNDEQTGDDRMVSLIEQCGVSERIIVKNQPNFEIDLNLNNELIQENLRKEREKAENYLKFALS